MSSFRKHIAVIAVVLFGGAFFWPLSAQSIEGQTQKTSIPSDSGLVSLDLQNEPLANALREIERQAGVSIVYQDDLVASVQVDALIERQSYAQALESLLAGTQLQFRDLDGRQIVITNRVDSSDEVVSPSFEGLIRDEETQQPLPGASVYLKQSETGVVANLEGRFQLEGDISERDTLLIRHLGYRPVKLPVRALRKGDVNEVNLSLVPIELPESMVTATINRAIEPDERAGMYTMAPEELLVVPGASEDNVMQTLQLLPGISGGFAGASGLNIRGGSDAQHLVLLDAMPLYLSSHVFGFGSAVNESILDEVRVFKGGFPAQYGGGTTGIIEMKTDPGNFKRFNGAVGLNGLHTYARFNVPIRKKASLQIAFRQSYSEFYKTPLFNKILNAFHGEIQRNNANEIELELLPDFLNYSDFNVKLTLTPGKKNRVTATFHHSRDELGYNTLLPAIDSEGVATGETELSELYGADAFNLGLSLQWNRRWSEEAQSELILTQAGFLDAVYSNAFQLENALGFERISNQFENTLADFRAKLRHKVQLSSGHSLNVGGWYASTLVELTILVQPSGELGTLVEEDSLRLRQLGEQFGINADYEWTAHDRLKIGAGLRSTYYTPLDQVYLEPRIFAQYILSNRVRLKGSWGNYRQFMDRLNYFSSLDVGIGSWILSDREVLPSRSKNRSLGVQFVGERYLFDVEAYSNKLSSVSEIRYAAAILDRDADAFEGLFIDGVGVRRGIEMLLQKRVGRLKGWLSYTLSRSEHRLDGVNDNKSFPTNHDNLHQGSAVVHYSIGSWGISLSWRYSSGKPYTRIWQSNDADPEAASLHVDATNGERLPATHQLDMGVKKTFIVRPFIIDAGVTLFNVYNRSNLWRRQYNIYSSPLEIVNYTAPGFTPTVSLNLTFP